MAKRRKNMQTTADLPIGAEIFSDHEVDISTPPAEEPTQTVMATITKLTVTVPSLDIGHAGYQSSRVDVQNLTGKQRSTLKCVMRGLEQREARLENGRHVRNYSDAIKYILENLT
jgi:hypothetical protein